MEYKNRNNHILRMRNFRVLTEHLCKSNELDIDLPTGEF